VKKESPDCKIFLTLDVKIGEFVRVISNNVLITLAVCCKHFGQDGIPHLHIEFIDRFFCSKELSKLRIANVCIFALIL